MLLPSPVLAESAPAVGLPGFVLLSVGGSSPRLEDRVLPRLPLFSPYLFKEILTFFVFPFPRWSSVTGRVWFGSKSKIRLSHSSPYLRLYKSRTCKPWLASTSWFWDERWSWDLSLDEFRLFGEKFLNGKFSGFYVRKWCKFASSEVAKLRPCVEVPLNGAPTDMVCCTKLRIRYSDPIDSPYEVSSGILNAAV